MAAASPKVLSFRSQLKGALSDFLIKEKIQCTKTEEALLDLVVALSHYTEEGQSLFPKVILCDDLNVTLRVLQCSDSLAIGSGPIESKLALEALKRCAPLAHDGWVVYLQRRDNRFDYGVIRTPFSPTAPSMRDTILTLIGQPDSPRMILMAQLADKAVELIGTRSGVLSVYLSATPDDAPPPQAALSSLVDAICAGIAVDKRECVHSFVGSILSTAIPHCHGALVAVLPAGAKLEDVTPDGVIFNSPISLAERVQEYEIRRSDESLAALSAYGRLVMGMLDSDGILAVDTQSRLLGYNLFVKDSSGAAASHIPAEGGARHRAYASLRQLVDDGGLKACYIRSRDGGSQFYER